MNEWIIFDADNTLWDIEFLYDDARENLCDYLESFGCARGVVEAYQRTRDVELYKTYGYSACRFARSFEDTVYQFLGSSVDPRIVIHCRKLALDVFESDPRHNPEVEFVLKSLKARYKIGLITAGERWVQKQRIERFHLLSEIDKVEVVEAKTKEVFEAFADRHGVIAEKSWVIGDSVSSDIKTSISAGFNAIWFKNHNWKENEHDQAYIESQRIDSVERLKELPSLLQLIS